MAYTWTFSYGMSSWNWGYLARDAWASYLASLSLPPTLILPPLGWQAITGQEQKLWSLTQSRIESLEQFTLQSSPWDEVHWDLSESTFLCKSFLLPLLLFSCPYRFLREHCLNKAHTHRSSQVLPLRIQPNSPVVFSIDINWIRLKPLVPHLTHCKPSINVNYHFNY